MIAIMSDALSRLFEALLPSTTEYRDGEAVFHRGDPVVRLHRVLSGEIHVLRHLENGAMLVQQRARPGDFVSEPSLHSDCYHCDARAAGPALTRSVSRERFRAALCADPNFAGAWADHLARQTQQARHRAEILSIRSVASRLDAWLSLNAMKLPDKGEWKTLAGEIAVAPEALYRELARRRVKGSQA